MVVLRPMYSPVMMAPSRRWAWMAVMMRRVPLQRPERGLRFWRTLSLVSCGKVQGVQKPNGVVRSRVVTWGNGVGAEKNVLLYGHAAQNVLIHVLSFLVLGRQKRLALEVARIGEHTSLIRGVLVYARITLLVARGARGAAAPHLPPRRAGVGAGTLLQHALCEVAPPPHRRRCAAWHTQGFACHRHHRHRLRPGGQGAGAPLASGAP